MDRSDEKRDDNIDERTDVDRDPGLLGIADANPPRDHVPGGEHVGREIETDRPGTREVQRSPGATSVDMGAGGTGTDVDRD